MCRLLEKQCYRSSAGLVSGGVRWCGGGTAQRCLVSQGQESVAPGERPFPWVQRHRLLRGRRSASLVPPAEMSLSSQFPVYLAGNSFLVHRGRYRLVDPWGERITPVCFGTSPRSSNIILNMGLIILIFLQCFITYFVYRNDLPSLLY